MNSIDVINKLIVEGRVEDMKAKYVDNTELPPIKRIPERRFNALVKGDPSGNQKYLDWMIQQVIRGDIIGVTTGYILKLVGEFHEKQNRLPKKDLYQYSGYHELEKALLNLPPSKSEMRRIQKEGSVKLYEDDRHLIVVPKTTEGSCYYGQGTKWCTAAKKNNQFENYSSSGMLIYIIDKSHPGKDENGHDFSKLALYIPYDIIQDYGGGSIRYLDHYDIELYDATDEHLEDALWSDYVMADDSVKLKMQEAMVKYFTKVAVSEKTSGVKTDEKLWKAIEENFNRYVPSNEYKFGNRWSRRDGTFGFDIIDGQEKYFISTNFRTNNYDTVYLDLEIVDYNDPGDVLDKASIDKRVPMDMYISEYDFDPRLIHWTILVSKGLATSVIKRYENKKRQNERQD